MRLKLHLIGIFLLLWVASVAHKFYTSITQIEYNLNTKSFECIQNVFTDDLELAISKENNKSIKSDDPKFEEYVKTYLIHKFILKTKKGKFIGLKFVGAESKNEMTSLYFEFPCKEKTTNLKISNTCFFELYKEQSNLVNLIYQEQKKSFLFRGDSKESDIN